MHNSVVPRVPKLGDGVASSAQNLLKLSGRTVRAAVERSSIAQKNCGLQRPLRELVEAILEHHNCLEDDSLLADALLARHVAELEPAVDH